MKTLNTFLSIVSLIAVPHVHAQFITPAQGQNPAQQQQVPMQQAPQQQAPQIQQNAQPAAQPAPQIQQEAGQIQNQQQLVQIVVNGPVFTVPNTLVGPGIPAPGQVYEILDLCRNVLTRLHDAKVNANMEAKYNNFAGATQLLIDGLNEAMRELSQHQYPNPYPHTYTAVKKSIEIVSDLIASTRVVLEGELAVQVEFLVMSDLYNAIATAFNTLDMAHYNWAVDYCRTVPNPCGPNQQGYITPQIPGHNAEFPRAYFDGKKKLAVQMLAAYNNLHGWFGSMLIERKVSASFAKATEEVLMESILREEFCPIMSDLRTIQNQVARWSQGNSAVGIYDQIGWIRSWMKVIQRRLDARSPGQDNCLQRLSNEPAVTFITPRN